MIRFDVWAMDDNEPISSSDERLEVAASVVVKRAFSRASVPQSEANRMGEEVALVARSLAVGNERCVHVKFEDKARAVSGVASFHHSAFVYVRRNA